jgi:peptidoglycan/xylan/chitin deacetylase (PgdA/CDA1 family)
MKVVLSFDDGRIDNYQIVFPILKKYGLTASIHITTGFIDGSFTTDEFGVGMKPLPIYGLKEMSEYGIDISSHGDKHKMEPEDFLTSKSKIHEWIGQSNIGFSVPNSSASMEETTLFRESLDNHISYIRVGRDSKCRSFPYKILYLLYKISRFQIFYNAFNRVNLNLNIDKFYIKSVVIKKHIKAKSVCKFIKKHAAKNAAVVLMLHTITRKPQNPWEWSINNFEYLCRFLKNMSDSKLLNETNLQKLVFNN